MKAALYNRVHIIGGSSAGKINMESRTMVSSGVGGWNRK